jgi:phytoene/squalene synthetase
MQKNQDPIQALAERITISASKQTYYTIRYFVDRDLVPLAYQAYAYFRWVDDVLDGGEGSSTEKKIFANRQTALLEACYRGEAPADLCPEEDMLVAIVKSDTTSNPGLRSYLYNMMEVMAFDAVRRGTTISQAALNEYTHALATAVTDALHYFIGHDQLPPTDKHRYSAVTAAHITHMLRDAQEDLQAGYINISHEYLQAQRLNLQAIDDLAHQAWTCQRVQQARGYFRAGRKYLARVGSLRCRLVGYAYTARFEWVLRTIARENYCLRYDYPERKGLRAGLWMAWRTVITFLASPLLGAGKLGLAKDPVPFREI